MPARAIIRESCRICEHEGDYPLYHAREMMYGSREEFDYFQCQWCGCVQIREVPADLARHYEGYWSLSPPPLPRGLAGWLKRRRDRFSLLRRGVIGRILSAVKPYPVMGADRWLTRPGVRPSSRILDVGGGAGHLLLALEAAGFTDLLSVDPFLPEDQHHRPGVRALRRTIHELDGKYDVIMLHHVLEHVPDQHETLASVARLLAPDGYCLVRTPTASSEAWETYREDWVQLDPPRHLYVHSEQSLTMLAEAVGLTVEVVEFDSTEFQFIGSEGYRRGVPLVKQTEVPRSERRALRRRAVSLNEARRGDQAAFYLRHAEP